MKVAIIGSNSFSGAYFASLVLEKTEYDVIGISRSPEPNSAFLPYKKQDHSRFKFFQLDLNKNMDEIIELLKKEEVNYIVNFAAQGMVGQSWENPLQWFKTNTLSIVEFTEKVRKELPNLKKFVQISSPEVYGSSNNETEEKSNYNPSSPYASSKAAGDMFIKNIIKQFNFPGVFVRSTNVYGPYQQLYRIIPIAIIKIKKGEKIQLHGGGKAIKSYIHIKDVCLGILEIMKNGKIGEVYHLSPESSYSIKSIVQMVCNKLNVKFEEFVELVDERPGQDLQYVINSEKARNELSWAPKISIDSGIEECVKWVEENWEVIKMLPTSYIHKE